MTPFQRIDLQRALQAQDLPKFWALAAPLLESLRTTPIPQWDPALRQLVLTALSMEKANPPAATE